MKSISSRLTLACLIGCRPHSRTKWRANIYRRRLNFSAINGHLSVNGHFVRNFVPRNAPEVRSSVTILHTGEVVPCCEDFGGTHIVGNIRNDSLADIWTGDKYQRLRAQVRAREPRMCRNCSFPGSVHFNQTIQLSPSRLPVAALIV